MCDECSGLLTGPAPLIIAELGGSDNDAGGVFSMGDRPVLVGGEGRASSCSPKPDRLFGRNNTQKRENICKPLQRE